MQAAVVREIGRLSIEEVDLAPPKDQEVWSESAPRASVTPTCIPYGESCEQCLPWFWGMKEPESFRRSGTG